MSDAVQEQSKDAGEIGAGHRVTALYETVPVGVSSPRGVDPLKYQPRPTESEYPNDTELLTVKLRYKSPEGRTSKLLSYTLAAERVREPSTDFKFAAAVAAFGMLLRGSPHHGDFEWKDVESLARDGRGADLRGYRREFLDLVEMAQLVARAER